VLCDDGRVVDKKEINGDEDEHNVEDMSGYEKSGVQLAWLGWEELIMMILNAGSGLVPTLSGMVNWLAHEILSSRSF